MDTKKELLKTCRSIADNIEKGSRSDYIHNPLDFIFITDSQKNYRSVEILVSFGGPNIYINTRTKTVEGFWGTDSVEVAYSDGDDIDDYFEELFNCI